MCKRLILIIKFLSLMSGIYAQINIWEGTSTKRVELTPYLMPGKDNVAIVICPGGSYFWHDMKHEGIEVANWLNNNGISAFVLRYRTAYVPAYITHFRYLLRGNRYPDAQNDLLQTMKWIRENSDSLGVNPTKIGVMGFSAGGHLAMLGAERLEKKARPNFIAAIYPVVSMSAPCTHKRSRRALIGENKKNDTELQDYLSIEHNVPEDCPPVFLLNCKDDPIVNYHNSELLDSALSAHNINHKYIQYSTGGHGFGASKTKGSEESQQWKSEFIKWLNNL